MASQTMVWAQSILGHTLKGQYRLDGILGEGAMGVVFRGVNLAMDKAVAIKMMRKETFDTPDAVERFNREARVWSKLNHPAITQVFDFGVQEGQPFLVMELVEGADLSDVLKREGQLEPLRAVKLIRQLAAGLEEAHRLGVVHRDIKPQNIKLLRYQPGGKILLKVLDFGMAKQVGKADQRLTAPGILVGTPKYVAPEQITENPLIDGRTDLYAAGVLFYELLTGQAPFLGPPHEVLFAHLGAEPKPLPESIPEMVRVVVMRLLRKRPDERFQNAAALEQALEECEMALRTPALPPYLGEMHAPAGLSEAHFASVQPSASSAELAAGMGQSRRSAMAAPSARSQSQLQPQSARSQSQLQPQSARSQSQLQPQSARSQTQLQPQSARSQSQLQPQSARSQPQLQPQSARSQPQLQPQSARSQPSGRSHSSVSSTLPVPSQSSAQEPRRGFSRTLLGIVFIVTMLGSAMLFYGLRHYLPLQRMVATWVPSFKVPQDEEVQLTLRNLEAERDKRQWAAVLRGVQFIEQRYGTTLLPEQTQALGVLRQKAQFEQPMQEFYDKLAAAAIRPDPEEVMRLYAQLAVESVYRPMAEKDYRKAVESYVATHLSKAEELRVAGRCAERLTELQQLLNVAPGSLQAQDAEQKPCPATGADLTSPGPGPFDKLEQNPPAAAQ